MRLGLIALDRVTFEQALARIGELVAAKAGGRVFTPNVDHFVLAELDPEFRAAYEAASLVVVDGTPVLWAARALGRSLPEKISGSDLLFPLAEMAAQRGWRVYLLGGAEGVAEETGALLRAKYPGFVLAGWDSPRIALDAPKSDGSEAVAKIRAAKPNLLLVALGSPKQELWIHRIAAEITPTVAIGVGAAFDFATGRAKRAPPWISKAGFEWLFRLIHEPRRLAQRYLVRDPQFAVILAREWWAGKRKK